ncbi:MAG: hypothetical protein AB1489_26885 [Acidobacteriota bacterium]
MNTQSSLDARVEKLEFQLMRLEGLLKWIITHNEYLKIPSQEELLSLEANAREQLLSTRKNIAPSRPLSSQPRPGLAGLKRDML